MSDEGGTPKQPKPDGKTVSGSETSPSEQAEAAAKAVLAKLDHEKNRFNLGQNVIAFGGLVFVLSAAFALSVACFVNEDATMTVELITLSAAIFAGACFALGGRLTTQESTLIQMKSAPTNAAIEMVTPLIKAAKDN